MDTKLLNKYIAGDVLPEEKKEVARWLKESEEHREQLMQLRHIYDATVWNANLKEEKPEKKKDRDSLSPDLHKDSRCCCYVCLYSS